MSMHHGLPSHCPAVHANVKPANTWVAHQNVRPELVEKVIDRPTLRLEQIEERRGVPYRYHERVQRGYGVPITDGDRESIGPNDPLLRQFAEDAARLAQTLPLPDRSEIG